MVYYHHCSLHIGAITPQKPRSCACSDIIAAVDRQEVTLIGLLNLSAVIDSLNTAK